MTLSEIFVLIGDLCNDAAHDRYTTAQIRVELDNEQRKWNEQAKILKTTVALVCVSGTRQYELTDLDATPIAFTRVTFDGVKLEKVDKSWLDLYTKRDWTTDTGTPVRFLVEATDPAVQQLTIHPTPTDADAGKFIVCEFIEDHAPVLDSPDSPFNDAPLTVPYHWGLCYGIATRLLLRDPTPENALKVQGYSKIATSVLQDVIQTFKALEKEEPLRLRTTKIPIRGIY